MFLTAVFCAWSLAWAAPQWGRMQSSAQGAQNVQITSGPTIENVTPNSAILAWSTNVGSSAIVHYGTDPNNLTQTGQAPWSHGTHRVTLNNLQPGMTYYFQVESAQGQGTGTGEMSPVGQFQTPAQGASSSNPYSASPYGAAASASGPQQAQITNGPTVEFVNDNSAVIAWSTNVPASTIVKYGTNPNSLTQMAEAPWGPGTHRVHLNNLQPSTTYYFQVESTQAQGTGTAALSSVSSFQTTAPGQQAKHYQR